MRAITVTMLLLGVSSSARPADPPKEDFNRPPRDKRAKLVEIADGGAGNYTFPLWLDGGKRLLLVDQYSEAEARAITVKGVAGVELVRGFNARKFLGTAGKGTRWVGFEEKGNGINSYARLVTWDFADPLKPYAKRLDAVDFDRPADGYPEAVTADGKLVLTRGTRVVEEGDRINPALKPEKRVWFFRALDAATGEPVRTVAKVEVEEEYLAHAFSPTANRLFLVTRTDGAPLARCFDTATGKDLWAHKFDGTPAHQNSWDSKPFVLTADGGTLALTNYTSVDAPPPAGGRPTKGGPGGGGRRTMTGTILVLDAATGKKRVALAGQGTGANGVYAISPDGRLLAGRVAAMRDPDRGFGNEPVELAIWDLSTGKVIKSWEHPANLQPFVTFAPNRPLMVLGQPGADEKQPSTLGFWDLSGLLK